MKARDVFTREKRSEVMKAVRRSGTPAELQVRALVREFGRHYRLNNRRLPGSPDLSNVSAGWAIFVHGCFWHGHPWCVKTKGDHRGRIPRTNRAWWQEKIAANRARDARKCRELRRRGLQVLTIWECELRRPHLVRRRLDRFLNSEPSRLATLPGRG